MATTQLSTAQVATLKAFVAASVDASIVAARTAGATIALRDLLNADAAGPVKAWNVSVGAQTLDEATPWTSFDTLDSAAAGGKKLSWLQVFRFNRDFSKAAMRKWVTDVWGNATAASNAEAILQACLVNATVAQNAIGGTVRTTGTVSGLDRDFVGSVSQEDCQKILA
jgi:hypothetical protein